MILAPNWQLPSRSPRIYHVWTSQRTVTSRAQDRTESGEKGGLPPGAVFWSQNWGQGPPPTPVLVPRTPRTLGDLASPLYLETCAGQSLEGFKGCCLKVGVGGESEREVTQDCSPLGFSVHGILQARILEWVAISFSRESSRPRDQTQGSNPCLLHCRQTL